MADLALVQTLAPNRHHHPRSSTMTRPRWTIDDEGLVRWRDLHAVAALNENNDDCFEAYDALVGAVRDADTLHQARQLVREYTNNGDPKYRFTKLNALLRLLAPPPPDTGAEP